MLSVFFSSLRRKLSNWVHFCICVFFQQCGQSFYKETPSIDRIGHEGSLSHRQPLWFSSSTLTSCIKWAPCQYQTTFSRITLQCAYLEVCLSRSVPVFPLQLNGILPWFHAQESDYNTRPLPMLSRVTDKREGLSTNKHDPIRLTTLQQCGSFWKYTCTQVSVTARMFVAVAAIPLDIPAPNMISQGLQQ